MIDNNYDILHLKRVLERADSIERHHKYLARLDSLKAEYEPGYSEETAHRITVYISELRPDDRKAVLEACQKAVAKVRSDASQRSKGNIKYLLENIDKPGPL